MAHYELIVIGAGPGGYEAALHAAKLGKKVAVVEKREAGGTCLNRGCIPTKALLHGAEVYQQAKEASKFGVNVGAVSYDYAKIAAHKDKVVSKLVGGIGAMEKAHGVDVLLFVITSSFPRLAGMDNIKFLFPETEGRFVHVEHLGHLADGVEKL